MIIQADLGASLCATARTPRSSPMLHRSRVDSPPDAACIDGMIAMAALKDEDASVTKGCMGHDRLPVGEGFMRNALAAATRDSQARCCFVHSPAVTALRNSVTGQGCNRCVPHAIFFLYWGSSRQRSVSLAFPRRHFRIKTRRQRCSPSKSAAFAGGCPVYWLAARSLS